MTKVIKITNNSKLRSFSGGGLDTLAQLGTHKVHTQKDDSIKLCACTQLDDAKTLLKRARRKYFGQALTLSLVDAAKQSPDSSLNKSYWNTFHCCSELSVLTDGRLSGHFCKNRWCMVCASIKTAHSINKYQPTLDTWENKQMVTLTIPNSTKADLKPTMELMHRVFTKIKDRLRKRHQRGQGEKFMGLRKFECTYNAHTNTYHPHFHVIVNGRANSDHLKNMWLDELPQCRESAQDVRPANSKSSIELFKYFTKVVSGKNKESRVIYADALDVIFNAVRGKRTFQPFGFRAEKLEDEENGEDKNAFAIDIRKWVQTLGDWVDEETGEMLTGHIPSDGMKELVTKKIIVRKYFNTS